MNVRAVHWWIQGDTEVCVFCLQKYAHGTQAWCVACDRAVCACCRRATPPPERAPLCPDCAQHEDEDG